MKTLIDRTCTRDAEITGKDFYFIVTAAVNSKQAAERTIKEFWRFTSYLSRAKKKELYMVPVP